MPTGSTGSVLFALGQGLASIGISAGIADCGATRGITLGWDRLKPFRILVEGTGGGAPSSPLRPAPPARRASFRRAYPDHRKAKSQTPSACRRYVFPPAFWRSFPEATGWPDAQGGRRSRTR